MNRLRVNLGYNTEGLPQQVKVRRLRPTKVIDLNNNLIKIQIRGVNGSLADTYELSYMAQDDNDFLIQIKKVNASGEFILPLQFDWSPMSYPYTYTGNIVFGSSPSVPNPQNTHSFIATQYGDIDGDGLMDLLVQVKMTSSSNSPCYWIVYRNNGDNTYQCLHENSWDYENEKTFLFLDLRSA